MQESQWEKGGKEHQDTIKEARTSLESQGYDVKSEYGVNTTGGYKDKRYLDLDAEKGGESFGVQVGRVTQGGIPVARERYAIEDINGAGYRVIFIPYNR